MDQETILLLAIVTLIVIGVFSAIINYWMWTHWKRTMGITKQIDEEILAPMPEGPTEPAPTDPEPQEDYHTEPAPEPTEETPEPTQTDPAPPEPEELASEYE